MSHSNTPPVRNRAPLTAWSSSLRCVLQPSTRLQNSTPKLAGQNPKSISQEAIYHGTFERTSSRYQVFEKLLHGNRSNVTDNITRPSDSFSTVPPIVNRGDWGCIVREIETIIVLVLLAFNSNYSINN